MEEVYLAPAKLNLAVDILDQYPNGEFQWDMIATSLNLFDYVHLKPRKDGRITLRTNISFVPIDHRNLAYQAASLLQKSYQVRRGADIYIDKNIPVSAGLGGGSSDAAAILRGLNQLWDLRLSMSELLLLALQLDEDVPYCLLSRFARAQGRGDELTPIQPALRLYFVVIKPDFSVSTKKIAAAVDIGHLSHRPDTETLIQGLTTGDYQQVISGMGNVLETVTAAQHPEINYLKRKLIQFGAGGAAMSGTGPTVFGLCHSLSRAHHILNSMRGFCRQAYLLQPYILK